MIDVNSCLDPPSCVWALGIFVTYLECERSLADERFRAWLVIALLAIAPIRPEGPLIALGVTAWA